MAEGSERLHKHVNALIKSCDSRNEERKRPTGCGYKVRRKKDFGAHKKAKVEGKDAERIRYHCWHLKSGTTIVEDFHNSWKHLAV